jgi:outer membrane protein OmpA-like peptidoglycan-associated protein
VIRSKEGARQRGHGKLAAFMRLARTTAVLAMAMAMGVALGSGCALFTPPPPSRGAPVSEGHVLGSAELARIRCVLVAPFENTTDQPKLGEVATNALLASIDPEQTRIFPVADLRALFRDTHLELPADGVSPRLALALGERVGADGVLYGVVEGRAQGSTTDFLVTVRLQAVGGRELLFAAATAVRPSPGESIEVALRRTLLLSARGLLLKIGSPGQKSCFDPEIVKRAKELRTRPAPPRPAPEAPTPVQAVAEPPAPVVSVPAEQAAPPPAVAPRAKAEPPPSVAPRVAPPAPAPAPATPTPAPVTVEPAAPAPEPTPPIAVTPSPAPPEPPRPPPLAAPSTPSGPAPQVSPTLRITPEPKKRGNFLSPRQTSWARKLDERARFVVDDVEFAGRSGALVADKGLIDLAKAIVVNPDLGIRLEVFVDATEDASEDTKVSMAMAMAATRRLAALGVARERILVEARGGDSPVMPNFSLRGRVANRRIEVVGLPAEDRK